MKNVTNDYYYTPPPPPQMKIPILRKNPGENPVYALVELTTLTQREVHFTVRLTGQFVCLMFGSLRFYCIIERSSTIQKSDMRQKLTKTTKSRDTGEVV